MKDFEEMVSTVREHAKAPEEVRTRVDATLESLPSSQGASQSNTQKLTVVRSMGKRTRRYAPRPRWAVAGVAAAAAIALCVATSPLGGTGTPALAPQGIAGAPTATSAPVNIAHAFTLQAAYGIEAANDQAGDGSKIAFSDQGAGNWGAGRGCYTGLVFKVTGEDIAHVSATLDKGQFYRLTRTKWTDADKREFAKSGAETDGENFTHMIIGTGDDAENGKGEFYDDFCEALGSSIDEAYDAKLAYGFYQPAEACEEVEKRFAGDDDNMRNEFHALIDKFDGATLTVMVTYTDGSSETKAYGLQSGKLKVKEGKRGEELQTLQEFTDGENEPYIYGLLATQQ